MKNIKKVILMAALYGVAASFLTGCGDTGSGSSSGDKKKKPEVNATIELKPVEGDFETHTDIQKQYFTSDDYKTLPSGIKGSAVNDQPNSLTLSWEIDAIDELTKASLVLSEEEDLSNGYKYDLKITDNEVESSKTITNLKVGTTYYWGIELVSDDKVSLSDAETFQTTATGPRFIAIDGVRNVRDIGGWATEDGGKVKQGLIYRGGEFNEANYGKTHTIDPDDKVERKKDRPYGQTITKEGIDTVLNELKIVTEIDVRGYEHYEYIDTTSQYYLNPSPTEIAGLKDGKGIIPELQYILNPIHTDHDKIYKKDGSKAAIKKFFTTLADESNYPVYFHCKQGKDRTGFLGYILDGLLGMSKEDMCRDFNASNFSNQGEVKLSYFLNFSHPEQDADRYDYGAYFDGYPISGMDTLTGSTMQERMMQYLISCGLTQAQLDKIIEINVDK